MSRPRYPTPVRDPDDEDTVVMGVETIRDVLDRWADEQSARVDAPVVDEDVALIISTPRVRTRALGSKCKVVVVHGDSVRLELP